MLRIGSGAGFAGDRIEQAKALVEEANLDYLILEGLAERTIALAQKQKKSDSNKGYNEYLEERIRSLLPVLLEKKVRLITNMGAANPIGAANKIKEIADELGHPCKIVAVTGDDVIDQLDKSATILENGQELESIRSIVSANAYLGIEAILPALETGADIIITGRVADPSLVLAPIAYHYQWNLEDFHQLGQGTIVGHLLECAGQITGGYFADPGRKDVNDLANLAFPYAIIDEDGTATITKLPNTGGVVNLQTVKEQLLYEVHDPQNYLTPDCVADFTNVQLTDLGDNCVHVKGGTGKKRPDSLKVSVGYHAGYLGEGEISYAGSTAVDRAELAKEILFSRLKKEYPDLRIDFIGVSSLHHTQFGQCHPYEVRIRAVALCETKQSASRIGHEVEALYTNGPAGGGGARKRTEEMIGIVSILINREKIAIKRHEMG